MYKQFVFLTIRLLLQTYRQGHADILVSVFLYECVSIPFITLVTTMCSGTLTVLSPLTWCETSNCQS